MKKTLLPICTALITSMLTITTALAGQPNYCTIDYLRMEPYPESGAFQFTAGAPAEKNGYRCEVNAWPSPASSSVKCKYLNGRAGLNVEVLAHEDSYQKGYFPFMAGTMAADGKIIAIHGHCTDQPASQIQQSPANGR